MNETVGGFAWTIPLIQFCFALLFLGIRRAGAVVEARTWSIAYAINGAAFAVSLCPLGLPDRIGAAAGDTLFALSMFVFGQALVQRHALSPWLAVRVPLLIATIALPLAGTIADAIAFEVLFADLGCAVQIAVPLLLIRRMPGGWSDRMLIALAWTTVVANLGRALSVPYTLGNADFADFLGTTYGHVMYIDGMVNGMAFGAVALTAVTVELLERYKRQAGHDPLTGLLNRRGFEAAAAGRQRQATCLIVCDLDHFKRVNDRCGHDIGDRVLVAFAELIRAALPGGALAARIGGEEFAILLPGHRLGQAQGVAMRLHLSLARHDWTAVGLGWRQSASFGLIERTGDASLADMLRLADAQLYAAKRQGRDRICTAPLSVSAVA